MTLPTETVELDGYTFESQLLPVAKARKAFSLLGRSINLFGVAEVAEVEGVDDAPADIGALTLAVSMGMLADSELEELIKIFAEAQSKVTFTGDDGTERVLHFHAVKTGQANLDQVFAGKFDLLLQWLEWQVKANFSTVIEKLVAAGRKRLAAKAEPKA